MWIKHTLLAVLPASIAVFMFAGCTGRADPSAYPTPILQITALDPVDSPITSPTPEIIRSTQTPQQSTALGLEHLIPDKLVSKVVEELAKQISLDPKEISLVEATPTNWFDSSLGCPQPGIEDSQVLIRGFRLVLEAKGRRYEYHTGDDEFILCEKNQVFIDPVPVMPIAPHGKPPKCQWTQCP